MVIRDRINRRWLCRVTFTGAVVGWMAFIFYLSSLSPHRVEEIQPLPVSGSGSVNVLRQAAAHLVLYAVLATLLQASVWSWKRGAENRLSWAVTVVALAALYGVSDELHQSTVIGRTASTPDALLNLTGSVIAVVSMSYLANILYKPTKRVD